MGLWATWSSSRCPYTLQGGWTRRPLKVPSNPNSSMILFYDFGADSAQTIWAGTLRSRCQTGRGFCHRSRLPLGENIVFYWGLETVDKTQYLVLGDQSTMVSPVLQVRLVQVPHLQFVKSCPQQPMDLMNTWTVAVIGRGIEGYGEKIQWKWEVECITEKVKKKNSLAEICF